jgi:hypothetical protein
MPRPWPVCPPPQSDESLASWFERVSGEYQMTPKALLSSMGYEGSPPLPRHSRHPLNNLLQAPIRTEVLARAQLPPSTSRDLWPESTGWELADCAFRSYCPHCCLEDLRHGRAPYGRSNWQQAWYTVCRDHGVALILRKTNPRRAETTWSRDILTSETHTLAPNFYRTLKVPRDQGLRCAILGSLLEIERATCDALRGIAPNRLFWGPLEPQEFLRVLGDLTTWALSHFEPVRAWSIAEDLTATEEQEGYGLIGRLRRVSPADDPTVPFPRTLSEIAHPKIRGGALWVAHSLMSASHTAASDRKSGPNPQDRQTIRVLSCSPAARDWLRTRQEDWPSDYRHQWWIDLTRD